MSKKGKKSKKWMKRVFEFENISIFGKSKNLQQQKWDTIDYRTSIENLYKAHERHESQHMCFNGAFSNTFRK